ncbi:MULTISPECIES: selenium metabolism-associated LysR family transcriptional regulator [unclassified Clostridium]|uniref:selenium metabolism-associated LysR family transcriptional regulator n=1 Tax=unclassified Clostridium TaxID=2614128 RepID=UPI000EC60FAF|nr:MULTISPECIES: selenium metabolism-associated LysR family transcriptional regulator [unclassified Clostridium]HCQ88901.1 LysR family transcriptional regulator [Clostridium sp.]
MDFKQLEAFITVAKLRSFSKAANAIYLSQPTISSNISSLEKELKIQLFDRTSKEVNLTPAGESFLEYATDIINTRNNAIADMSNFNNNISGRLHISASTTPCNSILPELISNFNDTYSNVKFNIKEQGSVGIIKDILDLNCEIGLVGTMIHNSKIKSYKIMDDELVIVSHPNLNLPEVVKPSDLLNYKFIIRERESATRKTFESALMDGDIDVNKLKVLCEVDNLDAQIKLLKLGMGVSILSKCLCDDLVNCNKMRISTIQGLSLKRSIYLIVSSRRTLTPIATAFFNMCKDMYGFKYIEK